MGIHQSGRVQMARIFQWEIGRRKVDKKRESSRVFIGVFSGWEQKEKKKGPPNVSKKGGDGSPWETCKKRRFPQDARCWLYYRDLKKKVAVTRHNTSNKTSIFVSSCCVVRLFSTGFFLVIPPCTTKFVNATGVTALEPTRFWVLHCQLDKRKLGRE